MSWVSGKGTHHRLFLRQGFCSAFGLNYFGTADRSSVLYARVSRLCVCVCGTKVLGIYTFTKRVHLDDGEAKPRRAQGYSTVSHFNVIHIECHLAAVRQVQPAYYAVGFAFLLVLIKFQFSPLNIVSYITHAVMWCDPADVEAKDTYSAFQVVTAWRKGDKKCWSLTEVLLINCVMNCYKISCCSTALQLFLCYCRHARGREEWESAALQNGNTKCNGLLPLWGPQVAESAYASCLARWILSTCPYYTV